MAYLNFDRIGAQATENKKGAPVNTAIDVASIFFKLGGLSGEKIKQLTTLFFKQAKESMVCSFICTARAEVYTCDLARGVTPVGTGAFLKKKGFNVGIEYDSLLYTATEYKVCVKKKAILTTAYHLPFMFKSHFIERVAERKSIETVHGISDVIVSSFPILKVFGLAVSYILSNLDFYENKYPLLIKKKDDSPTFINMAVPFEGGGMGLCVGGMYAGGDTAVVGHRVHRKLNDLPGCSLLVEDCSVQLKTYIGDLDLTSAQANYLQRYRSLTELHALAFAFIDENFEQYMFFTRMPNSKKILERPALPDFVNQYLESLAKLIFSYSKF
ncbi:MAG: hypothetical protein IBX55_01705 [Methyloprofundus sp.]|nr:hypothetical protein [Methyloprofundus sp.]